MQNEHHARLKPLIEAPADLQCFEPDLHFHDLRGTTVTILSEQGASPQEIATITGHSLTTVDAILDKYSPRTLPLAELAMAKLEKGLAGTFSEQIQQNAGKTAKRRSTKKDLSA
jgi:integrase